MPKSRQHYYLKITLLKITYINNIVTPEANPSSPSIQLKEFVSPTKNIIVMRVKVDMKSFIKLNY